MSTLSGEVRRLRRYLRDPTSNVWGNSLLLELWGEVQHDFQTKTKILESCAGLPATPKWKIAYLQDWEWTYLPADDKTAAYKALRPHLNTFTAAHVWEIPTNVGHTSGLSELGHAYTQPWEAFVADPARPPEWALPADLHTIKAIYFDRKLIVARTPDELQQLDSSYLTTTGEPWCYYREGMTEDNLVLYPRPSAVWVDDADAGSIQYVDGDPDATDAGAIIWGEGLKATAEGGVALQFVPEDDTLFVFYRRRTLRPQGWGDEVALPSYLLRYIRYGVLARAYAANTDGRIPSLSAFWANRYRVGIRQVEKFMRKRTSKIRRNLRSRAPNARRQRLPRLPSTYPPI